MALTALDALRQIQAELAGAPDEVPDGWMTDAQWARATDKGETTVRTWLKRGLSQGIVERRTFRLRMDAGHLRAVQHYRVKARGKK